MPLNEAAIVSKAGYKQLDLMDVSPGEQIELDTEDGTYWLVPLQYFGLADDDQVSGVAILTTSKTFVNDQSPVNTIVTQVIQTGKGLKVGNKPDAIPTVRDIKFVRE